MLDRKLQNAGQRRSVYVCVCMCVARDEGFEALLDTFRALNIDRAELMTTAFNIGEETQII